MNSLRSAPLFYSFTIVFLGISFLPPTRSQDPAAKTQATATASLPPVQVGAQLTGMQAFQQALKLFYEEKFAMAATTFEIAADTQTESFRKSHAYAWLARTDLHLHKVPEALAAAQKALEFGKDLGNAQTAMAEVYFRKGQLTDSEHLLTPLIKSGTGTARTYLALARIYEATGNYKSAHTLLEAAHKLDNKDPDIERAWFGSMSREELLREWKKRLEEGKFEDDNERMQIVASLAVLEDEQKNQYRFCRLVNKVSQTEIKLLPLLNGFHDFRGYGLSVKLNGTPATLLLDSGAGGILVTSKIAKKAGMSKIADTMIGGVGDKGAAMGYVAFAEKLKIGDLEFENCYVTVSDKKGALDDGLIGTDVFESYLIDVNFPNNRVRLSQLPPYPDEPAELPSLRSERTGNSELHNHWIPPEFAEYEGVYRFGHMLLLPAHLNKAPYHLFLLDTGAFDDIVSLAAAREVGKISTDSNIHVKGLSGEVKTVYTTENLLFTFGHFQQRREMVALDFNISNDIGTEVSGVLGIRMLGLLEIKLDYRDNLVDFQFEAIHIH